jgi:hypothetical protein
MEWIHHLDHADAENGMYVVRRKATNGRWQCFYKCEVFDTALSGSAAKRRCEVHFAAISAANARLSNPNNQNEMIATKKAPVKRKPKVTTLEKTIGTPEPLPATMVVAKNRTGSPGRWMARNIEANAPTAVAEVSLRNPHYEGDYGQYEIEGDLGCGVVVVGEVIDRPEPRGEEVHFVPAFTSPGFRREKFDSSSPRLTPSELHFRADGTVLAVL